MDLPSVFRLATISACAILGWKIGSWIKSHQVRVWYWNFSQNTLPLWIARRLPHRIVLWTAIRLFAELEETPDEAWRRAFNNWEARYPTAPFPTRKDT